MNMGKGQRYDHMVVTEVMEYKEKVDKWQEFSTNTMFKLYA